VTALFEHARLDFTDRASGDLSALDVLAEESAADRLPRRINADKDTAEQDLAKLVLALVDMVRQLLERQAIRRVNAGSLSEDEVERLGETFRKLERRMEELRVAFGLRREDLDLCLGSIRDLL
jgi:hypothetical protein